MAVGRMEKGAPWMVMWRTGRRCYSGRPQPRASWRISCFIPLQPHWDPSPSWSLPQSFSHGIPSPTVLFLSFPSANSPILFLDFHLSCLFIWKAFSVQASSHVIYLFLFASPTELVKSANASFQPHKICEGKNCIIADPCRMQVEGSHHIFTTENNIRVSGHLRFMLLTLSDFLNNWVGSVFQTNGFLE